MRNLILLVALFSLTLNAQTKQQSLVVYDTYYWTKNSGEYAKVRDKVKVYFNFNNNTNILRIYGLYGKDKLVFYKRSEWRKTRDHGNDIYVANFYCETSRTMAKLSRHGLDTQLKIEDNFGKIVIYNYNKMYGQ